MRRVHTVDSTLELYTLLVELYCKSIHICMHEECTYWHSKLTSFPDLPTPAFVACGTSHISTASDKRWGRNVCAYVINDCLTMAIQSLYALSTQRAHYLHATSSCCGFHCCFSHHISLNRPCPQIVVALE